jgi:hypothetical protein
MSVASPKRLKVMPGRPLWYLIATVWILGFPLAVYNGSTHGWQFALLAVTTLLWVWILIRLPVEGVEPTQAGIVVRAVYRTTRYSWTEIKRFGVEPWGRLERAFVELVDGRTRSLPCVGGKATAVRPVVDRLNQLLGEHGRLPTA